MVMAAPATTMVALDTAAGVQGGQAVLNVNLTRAAGAMPFGLQFDLSFPADLSITNTNQVAAGSVTQAAGASILASILSPTSIRVLIVSNVTTPQALTNGQLATIAFNIAPNATAGSQAVSFTNLIVSDSMGMAIASMGVNGSVLVIGAPVTATLVVDDAIGIAGQSVTLPISLASPIGANITGIELDLSFNGDLSISSAAQITAGSSATTAGASVVANLTSPTTARVLVVPSLSNPAAIISGDVIQIVFDVAPGAMNGIKSVTVTRAVLSDSNGNSLLVQSASGVIDVGGNNTAPSTVLARLVNGAAGQQTTIPLTLVGGLNAAPRTISLSLSFPSNLSLASGAAVRLGPAALVAGANISATLGAGTVTINLTGATQDFGDGDIAFLDFDVNAAAQPGSFPVTITSLSIQNAAVMALPSLSVNGAVVIPAPVAQPSTVTVGNATVIRGQQGTLPVDLSLGANSAPTRIEMDLTPRSRPQPRRTHANRRGLRDDGRWRDDQRDLHDGNLGHHRHHQRCDADRLYERQPLQHHLQLQPPRHRHGQARLTRSPLPQRGQRRRAPSDHRQRRADPQPPQPRQHRPQPLER
jgi:hypothetical protein